MFHKIRKNNFSAIFDVFFQHKFSGCFNYEGNVSLKTNKIIPPYLNVWPHLSHEQYYRKSIFIRKTPW
jgi:hypothetical protein